MGSRNCLRMNPISAPALCLSVWVFLSLVSVPSLADICFEGNPRNSFSGRRFHVTGSESDGRVCITVVRAPEDVGDIDSEEFYYTVSALGNPVFGQGTAAAGVDFLTSFDAITFPDGATSVEVCAAVLADDVACESGEDFQIRITSPNPGFNPICDVERAIVTLQDSTVITAAFAPLPAMFEVLENAGQFNVEVIRFSGIQNTNIAEFMIMEDPATPGCLAGPATVRYQCVAPRCGDGSMYNLTENIVSEVTLNLAPDDTLINGTKRCRIIFAPFSGSSCRFAFIGGSRPLVVRDNERFLMEFIPFNFYEAMEDEGGVDVTVEVRSLTGIGPLVLDKAVNFSLSLSVDPSNDPAQIGVDLPDQPYSSSVLAGQTSATVRILFTPDQLYEETEIVLATLIPTEDFNIIAPVRPATIQIINDDSVTIVFPDNISVSESDRELVFSLIVLEDHEVDFCLFVLSAASHGDPDSNPTIAKPGEDFAVIRQDVCFKDGSNRSEVVAVPILGSGANVPEEDKTFVVIVELPSETTNEFFNLPDRPGSVMLLDTSDPYMIDFSQAEYRVAESVGQLEVTINVDRPPAFDVPFTVRASTSGTGPQYAIVREPIGGDILGNEWSGFIPSGMTSAEFSIDIVEDKLAEYNEEFTLDLAVSSLTPRFAIVGETLNEAQVVILDDDEVTISLDAPSPVREGDTTTYNAVFSVEGNFEAPFSIDVMHLDVGTAVASVDYSPLSPKVTFTQFDKDQEVAVAVILNDGMSEVDKTFSFKAVKDPSTQLNVVTDSATAVVVIQDNEVLHLFDKVNYVVAEDDDSVSVSVRRRGYLGRSSVVSIVPNSGTGANPAEGSQDFPKLTVVASFSAGEELKEFEVPITSDMRSELNETFLLQLLEEIQTPPVLVEDLVVEPSQATVTITDFNASRISFTTEKITLSEEDGNNVAILHLVASHEFQDELIVQVAAIDDLLDPDESGCIGKTRGDRDYTLSSNITGSSNRVKVRFPPNSKVSDPFRVQIVDDDEEENWEKFHMKLIIPDAAAECGAILGENRTLEALIEDDDGIRVGFEVASISKTGTEGKTVTLNIYRHGSMRSPTKISIAAGHITTAKKDFKAKKSVTFKKTRDQSEVAKLKIKLGKDKKVEGTESFAVRLTGSNRPSVGFDRRCAVVTIVDPPTPPPTLRPPTTPTNIPPICYTRPFNRRCRPFLDYLTDIVDGLGR